jgi:hypothetical protein
MLYVVGELSYSLHTANFQKVVSVEQFDLNMCFHAWFHQSVYRYHNTFTLRVALARNEYRDENNVTSGQFVYKQPQSRFIARQIQKL